MSYLTKRQTPQKPECSSYKWDWHWLISSLEADIGVIRPVTCEDNVEAVLIACKHAGIDNYPRINAANVQLLDFLGSSSKAGEPAWSMGRDPACDRGKAHWQPTNSLKLMMVTSPAASLPAARGTAGVLMCFLTMVPGRKLSEAWKTLINAANIYLLDFFG